MKSSFFFFVGAVGLSVSLTACTSALWQGKIAKTYNFTPEQMLSAGPFLIDIQNTHAGSGKTHYYMNVIIKNQSAVTQVFDVQNLQARDIRHNRVFKPFARRKNSVFAPGYQPNLITKLELKPNETVQGTILFPTEDGRARAQEIELALGADSITMSRHSFMSRSQWAKSTPSGASFRTARSEEK